MLDEKKSCIIDAMDSKNLVKGLLGIKGKGFKDIFSSKQFEDTKEDAFYKRIRLNKLDWPRILKLCQLLDITIKFESKGLSLFIDPNKLDSIEEETND
jgi:hypothetical protein